MGCKASKCLIMGLLLSMLIPTNVKAEETAVKLYNHFDLSYSLVYPDDVLQTISSYQYAQKYNKMYRYVINSTFDETTITDRITKAKEDLYTVEKSLNNGYHLSRDAIYSLNSQYMELTEYISLEESKLTSVEVDYSPPQEEDIPSYEEYIEAVNKRKEIELHADIGTVEFPMKVPVASAYIVEDSTPTSILFSTADGASVSSMWNGIVESVSTDRVVISCHNEILLGYANLKEVLVEKGDAVYQGQTLGKSSDSLLLKLSLNGNFVNISKLFIEE